MRIRCDDGAVGVGYTYTIGTGGSSVVALLRDHLAPKLIGRDPDCIEAIWKDLFFHTHATAVGAITSLALAAIDTALWDLRCRRAGLPLWKAAGGAQPKVPVYTTEGGWLHLSPRALVDADASRRRRQGFRGAKIKVGKPHVVRGRRAARRGARGGRRRVRDHGRREPVLHRRRRRSAARARSSRSASRGSRSRCRPRTSAATSSSPRTRRSRSRSASRSTTRRISANTSSATPARSCRSTVARIGGITPWLKVAHLAETFNVAGLSAFPDGAARVADGRGAERARGSSTFPQLDDITTSRLAIADGYAVAPSAPGLGIDWDFAAIERRAVARASRSGVTKEIAMLTRTSLTIRLHPNDDVVIARTQLVGGTLLADESVTVSGLVPPGHKVATRAIRAGAPVKPLQPDHRLRVARHRAGRARPSQQPAMGAFDRDYAFGADVKPTRLRRRRRRRSWASSAPDGRVATRNYIGILSTVNCSATVVRGIADHFTRERLAAFPNVDGVVALTHGSGCGMDTHGEGMTAPAPHARRLRAARELRRRADRRPGLRGEPDQRAPRRGAAAGRPAAAHLQHPGHRRHREDRSRTASRMIEEMLPHANDVARRPVPASHITVGLQCGGSDGYSGITANPALGAAVDLLVRHGGTAILSETPEIYGAEHLLTRRAVSRAVGEKLDRADQVVGGLHGARAGRDEQQSVAGQQGGRPHDDPREIAGRRREGRHDQPRRRLRIRRAGRRRRASSTWTRPATTRCRRRDRSPAART